jgi:hypothetical protein
VLVESLSIPGEVFQNLMLIASLQESSVLRNSGAMPLAMKAVRPTEGARTITGTWPAGAIMISEPGLDHAQNHKIRCHWLTNYIYLLS